MRENETFDELQQSCVGRTGRSRSNISRTFDGRRQFGSPSDLQHRCAVQHRPLHAIFLLRTGQLFNARHQPLARASPWIPEQATPNSTTCCPSILRFAICLHTLLGRAEHQLMVALVAGIKTTGMHRPPPPMLQDQFARKNFPKVSNLAEPRATTGPYKMHLHLGGWPHVRCKTA